MQNDKSYWEDLSTRKLPDWFLEKYAKKIDWVHRCEHFQMLENEIDKYAQYFDECAWDIVFKYQTISDSFAEKHIKIIRECDNWSDLNMFQTNSISENFIDKYIDEFDCICLARDRLFSESFLEKHSDKLNWNDISIGQEMSRDFIMKHRDKLIIELLKRNPFVDFKTYLKQVDNEDECCVCYDKVNTVTITCNHRLCSSCAISCMKESDICPCCRRILESRFEFELE